VDVRIAPSGVSGAVNAVPSKSAAHRLLVCAALSNEVTHIGIGAFGDDVLATVRCLRAMGHGVAETAGDLCVSLRAERGGFVELDCGESGTTARFLLPVAACLFDGFAMTGRGRLPWRPFTPLVEALAKAGCRFDGGALPLKCSGRIRPGDFEIPGGVSSQFVSGLLLALPLLSGDSRVIVTGALESAGYVEMTIDAMALFGVGVERHGNVFCVKGNQRYVSPETVAVEGDWSSAAFFFCMGALGGPVSVSVSGLPAHSRQGDWEILDVLRRFGARVDGNAVGGGMLRGTDVDAAQIPDLVPALAAVASVASGRTRVFNARRLRDKESDRIKSTADMLRALGGDVEATDDGLLINGKKSLRGGAVAGAGDHRIVMAAAVASCACENPVVIEGCEAVGKSYPGFFDDFRSLGGIADVV